MGMSKRGYPTQLDRRRFLKYGLSASLAACLPSTVLLNGCTRKSQAAPKPSVFLITVDTLRADRLSCYGYEKATSPYIDDFAEEALLFENCLSHAPETRMSFASILTGFYPHETKITPSVPLPDRVETLPEILKKQGYKTAAVISNYVLRRNQGYEQGFDVYDDTMEGEELVRRQPERIAPDTTNRALDLIKQFRDERLFMWIHYQDPHGPYTPPAEYARKFHDPTKEPRILKVNHSNENPLLGLTGRGGIPAYQYLKSNDYYFYTSRYDSEISYADQHFQRLIEGIKEAGLFDDALIVFSSDHGEGLGEHDYFFAHGEYLYRHQLHVPLIIKHGKNLTGRRSDYVQHIDLVPTICNILGIKADARLRGTDLRNQQAGTKTILSEMKSPLVPDGTKYCLTGDGLKLIYTPSNKAFELYDLSADAGEENNLRYDSAYRKRASALVMTLDRLHKEDRLGVRSSSPPPKLTEEEKEKLRSLGYLE
jgi:arylsulfatase A-like enzyme